MEVLGKVKNIRAEIERILSEEANLVTYKCMSNIFINENGEVFKYVLSLCFKEDEKDLIRTSAIRAYSLIADFVDTQDIEIRIRISKWKEDTINAEKAVIDNKLYKRRSEYKCKCIEIKQTNYSDGVKDVIMLHDVYGNDYHNRFKKLVNMKDKRGSIFESDEKSVELFLSSSSALSMYVAMSKTIEKLKKELDNNVIMI